MLNYKGKPNITTIVLHHTATSRSIQPLQKDHVNEYHKQKWHFPSELNGSFGGYNFFCEPTGERFQYRFIGEETIAQIGNNCDVPARCGMVSYCMAGDFRVEKPTQSQVNDFVSFVKEIRATYPKAVIKQHKDVAEHRTCAELSEEEIKNWFSPSELESLRSENTQLRALITLLIKKILWLKT